MPSETLHDQDQPSRAGSPVVAGLRARWRHISPAGRIALTAVAFIVLAGALVKLTSVVTEGSSPEGPASSSFSPTSDGLEGYAQLLGRNGDHVTQLTSSLDAASIASGSTVVVADPTSWESTSDSALARVLDSGGRVVLAGQPPSGLLSSLLAGPVPTWSPLQLTSAQAVAIGSLVYGVTQVDSTGPGLWETAGRTSPLLASGQPLGGPIFLALSARIGAGTLVMLATPAPLQNRLLAQADNAAFGLDIAGSSGTSVVFDEYDHGYGRAGGGLGGLPVYWKAGLWLLLIAILVWMLSAIRRFGPPQDTERDLAPPRVQYVDAMARVLATGSSDRLSPVTERLQARARDTLSRRSGVMPGSSDEEVREGARRSGFDEHLVEAVLNPPQSADDLVAVGRASSVLSNEDR
jgi:hypothetical protein